MNQAKCRGCGEEFVKKKINHFYCKRECGRKLEIKRYYHKNKIRNCQAWKENIKKHRNNVKIKLLAIYGNACSCCG